MSRGDLLVTKRRPAPAVYALGSRWGVFLFAVFVMAVASRADDTPAPRPNIVLILCDDLGYADVGFNGSTDITTPHLDSLAKNGTIFSSAYVTHPFCGPSRMGLMAGRYPHSFGAPL